MDISYLVQTLLMVSSGLRELRFRFMGVESGKQRRGAAVALRPQFDAEDYGSRRGARRGEAERGRRRGVASRAEFGACHPFGPWPWVLAIGGLRGQEESASDRSSVGLAEDRFQRSWVASASIARITRTASVSDWRSAGSRRAR